MAEYPIHPYIIHCLEPLLANAAAPVVLALDGRCGSGGQLQPPPAAGPV